MERRRESTISLCVKWICEAVAGKETEDNTENADNKLGSKDDIRRENERLCTEIDSLSRDFKKLKQIVEQLRQEYEESKVYDPLRRYEKLKGMVKRTIMHVRLNGDEATSGGRLGVRRLSYVQGCKEMPHQVELVRKREEKFSKMSRQELEEERSSLMDQERDLRRKCSIIRDLLQDLQQDYDCSKQQGAVQRYSVLKDMVKKVIHDDLV